MRVLHVTPTYVPAWRYGGPIRSVHGLCRALVHLGVEVHVFTTSVDGPKDLDVVAGAPVDVDGVKVWYFKSSWLRRLYYTPALREMLRERAGGFDLIHLNSVFLWPTWAAARVAQSRGVPYVLSPRGMLVHELIARKSTMLKNAWIALIERRNLERAAAVHVTSPTEGEALRRFGFELRSVVIVPNGVDLEEDAGTDGLPRHLRAVLEDERPVVLFLGRINWKKGLDRLIRAIPRVAGVRLLLVGNDEEGYTRQLASLAADCGVQDRVVFGGPVYGAARAELYSRAAIFALPSQSENFGITVLEAMSEGCAVVVTAEVGAAAIVADAGAGLVVDGSPEALSQAIGSLLSDRERRIEMGLRGRQAARAKYGWERIAGLMLEHYRAIIRAT